MNIAFADRLIKLRKSHSLSQEELALKLGVSRQAVSKWERAESSPDTDNLVNLAKLYNISLDSLIAANKRQNGDDALTPPDFIKKELNGMDLENGNGVNPNAVSEYKVIEESREKAPLPFQDSRILIWLAGCYPALITIVYLILGFMFDLWHPAWMLFLTIPLFYSYYNMARKK